MSTDNDKLIDIAVFEIQRGRLRRFEIVNLIYFSFLSATQTDRQWVLNPQSTTETARTNLTTHCQMTPDLFLVLLAVMA